MSVPTASENQIELIQKMQKRYGGPVTPIAILKEFPNWKAAKWITKLTVEKDNPEIGRRYEKSGLGDSSYLDDSDEDIDARTDREWDKWK